MIVVDASAAIAALLGDGAARATLRHEALHAPHLVDVEVAQVLRRRVANGSIGAREGAQALGVWRRLGITRHAMTDHLGRIWQLRHNVTAYDAAYVSLAETLRCPLLTADARLAEAPGVACTVTTVRS